MARPTKSGLEYFPLDVDFFEDEKVIAISREFGCKGEAVTLRLLCAVFRHGYFAVWGDGLKGKLLRSTPGLTTGLLEQIVNRLVQWDFFDARLFHSAKVLTSKGIQRRYFTATKRRQTGENPAFLLIFTDANDDPQLPLQTTISWSETGDTARGNGVSVCNNPQRKVKIKRKNVAAVPASTHAREPEESLPPETQVHTATALPVYAETVISSDCIERFRAYCEAWNTVVGKPRIPPDIPHYAEMFAMTEHRCQDTTLFARVIEHLRTHPQSVVRTGKISLKATTIFSVDFVTNVLASAYDTDFSKKQQATEKRKALPWGRGGFDESEYHEPYECPDPDIFKPKTRPKPNQGNDL